MPLNDTSLENVPPRCPYCMSDNTKWLAKVTKKPIRGKKGKPHQPGNLHMKNPWDAMCKACNRISQHDRGPDGP